MTHCRRCRADAVGLLHEDRSGEMAGVLRSCASTEEGAGCSLPKRGTGLPRGRSQGQTVGH